MMTKTFVFGDIVLLNFPFSNGHTSKKRPAMVLWDNQKKDLVLCQITTQKYDGDFDIELGDWRKSGLLAPSWIRLEKIATLERNLVEKKIGRIYGFDAEDTARMFSDLYLKIVSPLRTITITKPHYELLTSIAQRNIDLARGKYETLENIEDLFPENKL